ncbi:hypothetical protein HU675_0007995 [Bradyrhizobium septentrionale]|uniref:hypothetical protein n=1 Tax=Bradyrhizobium septentrionale TaxID=1404411 RepID=UPI001CD7E2EF|nr:hypothetical protein [Bradyrhizobium septentrionale]UGY29930.1 hypothetical protein HU675_0007995 [Bradyrhizobium septentrionale]
MIVFGLDPTGKPKAGRFPGKDATLARKAALALKLAVCKVNRPRLVELVTRIPLGRLHAQGRAFLPFIKPDLYQELAAAATPSMAAAAKLGPNVSMAPEAKPPKDRTRIAAGCQSAFKFDPSSASNFDPFARRALLVALVSSELAGIAEARRARVA